MKCPVALVVDDHLAVRRALCDRIHTAFGQVLVREAGTVDAALTIVGSEKVDIVLMDIHLPGTDGIEGTRAVLERSPGTSVVVVSILDDLNHRSAANKAGASAFVCKRAISTELVPVLHGLMNAGQGSDTRWSFRGGGANRMRADIAPRLARKTHVGPGFRFKPAPARVLLNRRSRSCTSAAFDETIVDAAADAIIVVDELQVIRRFNHSAERMFGYREADLEGKNVELILPLFRRVHCYRSVQSESVPMGEAVADDGSIASVHEIVARRIDGTEFPASLSTGAMRAGGRFVFTCIVRDVTEARQADLQQRNLVADLEIANKELDGFGYMVSHELRAPLRALDGYSQVLMEHYGGSLDDEGLRLLGVIRRSSRKMGNLINELLTFSKVGRVSVSASEFDMNALVREVLSEIQPPGDDSARCYTVDVLPAAWGDRDLLSQVWVNLLSNAFKFTSRRERPSIRVSAQPGSTETVYCVTDNGAGFDMRYCDRLFGVFQRLHGETEFPGTGVGLSIVKRIVSRHGGRVWAEGRLNEGARFYFTLPHGAAQPRNSDR